MCGFAGEYQPSDATQASAADVIERGLRLRHRGPDQFGTWVDGSIGVASARLALLDPEMGSQPMRAPRGTVLVYNGEIYNNLELRSELTVRGWRFRTRSDTEVLLAAYEIWGEKAWARLNGMFAAAIYDQDRQQLILVRDRLGIKPLFYRIVNGRVEFASEPSAWPDLRSPEVSLNPRGILRYLRFAQPVLGRECIINDLRVLEPGTMLIASKGRCEIRRWHFSECDGESAAGFDSKFVRAQVRHLLHLAVGRQLVADAPVGVLLSGGMDSSLLLGLARQMTPTPIRTYSVALTDDDDDLTFAARVAAHWRSVHTELRVSPPEFFAAMRELIRLRSWPVSLPNEVLIYCIAQQARLHVKAVLSGEGADELFGGYSNIIAAFQVRRSHPDTDLSDFLTRVYGWFQYDELQSLLNATWKKHLNDTETLAVRVENCCDDADELCRLMYWFEYQHLPHLLARLDGASMAGSIEGRVPYTDHDLVDFTLILPPVYKIGSLGLDKPLLRETYADLVPEFVLTRPKRAFHASLEKLLLSPEGARELASVADDPCMSEIFDRNRLRTWMKRNTHPAGLFRQWLLLGLNLWLKRNIL